MKVKELIEELSKIHPDVVVLVFNPDTCCHEDLEEIYWEDYCTAVVLEKSGND